MSTEIAATTTTTTPSNPEAGARPTNNAGVRRRGRGGNRGGSRGGRSSGKPSSPATTKEQPITQPATTGSDSTQQQQQQTRTRRPKQEGSAPTSTNGSSVEQQPPKEPAATTTTQKKPRRRFKTPKQPKEQQASSTTPKEQQQQPKEPKQAVQSSTSPQTTGDKPKLRVPKFIKIKDVEPGAAGFYPGQGGFNIVCKVVSIEVVAETKEAVVCEVTVGDETGCVILSAHKDQLKDVKVGSSIILRNAKITLFKKSLRLKVDMWGKIQNFEEGRKVVSVPLSDEFTVNTSKNLSKDGTYEPLQN